MCTKTTKSAFRPPAPCIPRAIFGLLLAGLVLILSSCGGYTGASWGEGGNQGNTSVVQEGLVPNGLIIYTPADMGPMLNEVASTFSRTHGGAKVSINYTETQFADMESDTGDYTGEVILDSSRDVQSGQFFGSLRRPAHLFVKDPLVVILPPNNPAHITSLQDLGRPGLRAVFADYNEALGKEWIPAMVESMMLYPQFGKLYAASVLGNADVTVSDGLAAARTIAAGGGDFSIVYRSDAVAVERQEGRKALKVMSVPTKYIAPISIYIAQGAYTPGSLLLPTFESYLYSSTARTIEKIWGFTPATGSLP
jgi:molybdate transport system substrate-binding protein